MNNFNFKKQLGQNFLIDEETLFNIVNGSNISKDDFVLEIGPGNGKLTEKLLPYPKALCIVEIDKELIPILNDKFSTYKNISIIHDDFLKMDFDIIINEFIKFGFDKNKDKIKVIANLPYYITGPIIFSLLENDLVSEIVIMVQKEVADRLVSPPNSRDYGVITVIANYFGEVKKLFNVPKEYFYPRPKVDSAVIKIDKYSYSYINEKYNNTDYNYLKHIIKIAFQQRRKTLVNSLSNQLDIGKSIIKTIIISIFNDENIRPENLSLDDYIELSSKLNGLASSPLQ